MICVTLIVYSSTNPPATDGTTTQYFLNKDNRRFST